MSLRKKITAEIQKAVCIFLVYIKTLVKLVENGYILVLQIKPWVFTPANMKTMITGIW